MGGSIFEATLCHESHSLMDSTTASSLTPLRQVSDEEEIGWRRQEFYSRQVSPDEDQTEFFSCAQTEEVRRDSLDLSLPTANMEKLMKKLSTDRCVWSPRQDDRDDTDVFSDVLSPC